LLAGGSVFRSPSFAGGGRTALVAVRPTDEAVRLPVRRRNAVDAAKATSRTNANAFASIRRTVSTATGIVGTTLASSLMTAVMTPGPT
jgi:hypothetical protein